MFEMKMCSNYASIYNLCEKDNNSYNNNNDSYHNDNNNSFNN